MNYKNLNSEIETIISISIGVSPPTAMNYKNLNSEIETISTRRGQPMVLAMNYKNLNSEIETLLKIVFPPAGMFL